MLGSIPCAAFQQAREHCIVERRQPRIVGSRTDAPSARRRGYAPASRDKPTLDTNCRAGRLHRHIHTENTCAQAQWSDASGNAANREVTHYGRPQRQRAAAFTGGIRTPYLNRTGAFFTHLLRSCKGLSYLRRRFSASTGQLKLKSTAFDDYVDKNYFRTRSVSKAQLDLPSLRIMRDDLSGRISARIRQRC